MTEYPFDRRIDVPLFDFDAEGAVLPNPIFHRSWDRLHSRCIEYPFAASQVINAPRLLDVGSVKGDRPWLDWLRSLPIDVHFTDYDPDQAGLFAGHTFHQGDLRHLPIEDNYFDQIAAVSVIEHVGMGNPQVRSAAQPPQDADGDILAFAELLRVLKPGGRIIVTVPYGVEARITGQKSGRAFDAARIARLHALAEPVLLEYYEYQYNESLRYFPEQSLRIAPWHKRLKNRLLRHFTQRTPSATAPVVQSLPPRHFGLVTWRRIPPEQARARNMGHIDGVFCGVWRKR